MGFVEATYLVLGMVLGVVGIAVVRWLLLRPLQPALISSMIEEFNRLNGQLRRLTDRMTDLARSLEGRPNTLTGDHVEMSETLSEMNRLLREINEFFARADVEGSEAWTSDFVSDAEEERFRRMERLSDEEIAKTDWDELLDRLREEEREK